MIIREQFLELRIQLSCQGLIMYKNQSWLINFGYYIRYGKCLTGTSCTQQYLTFSVFIQSFHQLVDRLRLIALGNE